jgi:hypothetical protein
MKREIVLVGMLIILSLSGSGHARLPQVNDTAGISVGGEYASGFMTFLTGYPATADISIPAGTRVFAVLENSNEKIWYKTTAAATLATGETEATVAVVAEERGVRGNIPATVGSWPGVDLESYIAYISSVELRRPITGGTEG